MSFRQKRLAALLVTLMVTASISIMAGATIAPWEGQTHPRPSTPGGSVDISTTGFILPANGTITEGWLNLTTDWNQPGGNGSGWSAEGSSNFSDGTHLMTTPSRFDGALSLDQDQSVGTLEDFENLEETFLDWYPAGPDSLIWSPSDLNLSGTNSVVGNDTGIYNQTWDGVIPSSPTQGTKVITTLGNPPSAVPNGTYAWLEGPEMPLPNVIRNYSANFQYWMDLNDGGGWVEYTLDGGQWQVLNPESGYPDNLPINSPQQTGYSNDSATGWKNSTFQLDSISGIHDADFLRLRFVIWTDENASSTGPGWFIDNLTFSNEGEPLACWFHGNLNGAYANDANSWLQMNFSTLNLTNPMEITVSLDWDLEGGFNDNLIVEASNDNQTWHEISLPPGIPGVGLITGGIAYADESGGWVDISMPMLSIFQNRSNMWLRFRVETDYAIGYGSSLNGWEGVMIDDVILKANSSNGRVEITLDNFTTNDSVDIGVSPGANEEWQYLTDRGHNGPSSATYGFESTIELPRGWHLNHIRGGAWELGQTNNGSGWGPGSFPDNGNGAGLNLHGQYAAQTLTHLETKDWNIPVNSSARLIFDHWVCTEANWDGGIIHISDDEGLSWTPFGQNDPNFYDALSTANPFSPLYNLKIFDGSSNPTGCNVQPWVTKEGNLSSWAGETVRFRFTFFSDTYLEGAGWYIDNVGVEVDLFEPVGSWTSPSISSGPTGYGMLSIGGEIPPGTEVSATILDSSGTPLYDYIDKSLPVDLRALQPYSHPAIHVRLKLETDDLMRTPVLQNIHFGDNLFLTKPSLNSSGWLSNPQFPVIWDVNSTSYVAQDSIGKLTAEVPLHRPARSVRIWCDCGNVYLSATPESNPNLVYLANQIQQPSTTLMNGIFLRDIQVLQITIDLQTNGWIKDLYVETEYSDVAINPQVDLKGDAIPEWEHTGAFGISSDINGSQQQQFYTQSGQTHTINLGYHNFTQVYDGFVRIGINTDLSTITTISFGGLSRQYTGPNGDVIFPLYDIVSGQSTNIHFTTTDDASITIYGKSIPYNHQFVQTLPASFLSNISVGLEVNQTTGEFKVPVNLTTQNGGFVVGGAIVWERLITDTFLSNPPLTIYPDGDTFSFETQSTHLHNDGLIENVILRIGTTRDVSNAEVEFKASNLSTSPLLEIIKGSSLMSLNTTGSWYLGDSDSSRRINWEITPTREWGDQPILWWMLESSSAEESTLGPVAISTGGSAGPAVEVDLEVINTFVSDQFGNSIADESHPNYPWSLQSSSQITVGGFVRFQGSPNVPSQNGMATVSVTLQDAEKNITTSNVIEINNGYWSTNITMPNEEEVVSGDELWISPRLNFDNNDLANGVSDETHESEYPRVIFDSQSPTLGTLYAITPDVPQPANGHVWYKETMLALSIEVGDDVRQGEFLNLHYWIEGEDDLNSDGQADAEEYRILSEQLSQNSLNQTVDFPLIDVSSAIPLDEEWGEVSLWISGKDLAGNQIAAGGSAGLDLDLATVQITSDTQTIIESGSVDLDIIEGFLLAGHQHTFSAVINEPQGIESLDKLILDISGEVDGNECAITWYPWSDVVEYQTSCYVNQSVYVNATEVSMNTWNIEYSFIIPWLNDTFFGDQSLIPYFAAFDLGQDIGLGYGEITPLSWNYNGGAEIVVVEINDMTDPEGALVDDTLYISSNDMISVGVIVVHTGTDIPLDIGYGFEISAGGGINMTSSTGWYNGDGEIAYASMVLKYDDYPNLLATLTVEPIPLANDSGGVVHLTGETYSIEFDNYAPRITTTPNIYSVHVDRMDFIPVTFDIVEASEMNPDTMEVHFAFKTVDNETRFSGSSPAYLSSRSGSDWNYHAALNFTPQSELFTPQSTDTILVWVDGFDYAGNQLRGTGSGELPIIPEFIAPLFLPTFSSSMIYEDTISIGEDIVISSSLVNQGDASGNATVALYVDGNWIDSQQVVMSSSGNPEFILAYMTQRIGDHNITLVLNETGESINLSIEVVVMQSETDVISAIYSIATGILLGVAFLFVIAAIVIVITGRNDALKDYDDAEFTDFEEE